LGDVDSAPWQRSYALASVSRLQTKAAVLSEIARGRGSRDLQTTAFLCPGHMQDIITASLNIRRVVWELHYFR